MPKFFQSELAAYSGEKTTFQNVKFKKSDLSNSSAAEAGTILEIIPVHIKNPPVIQFIAYLDSLADNFNTNYSETQPFGRPDPYYVWKSNKRSIRVAFSIPSSSVATALDNMNSLSWFLGSLYPSYKTTQTATSIAASPMFRVRFSNLICSSTNDGQGLLGVIKGTSVTHQVKEGFIGLNPQNMGSSFGNTEARLLKEAGFEGSVSEGKKFLVPKLMTIGFTLDVVHDHSLGWDYNTGQWRGGSSAPRFPHDFGLNRDTSDTPSAGATVFEEGQNDPNPNPGSTQAKVAASNAAALTGQGSGTDPTVEVHDTPETPAIEGGNIPR